MDRITDHYKSLNTQLHQTGRYGKWGWRQAEAVHALFEQYGCQSALDYGAGQQTLSQAVSFPMKNYDPCVPGIDELPEPADLVNVGDVMEHIEPELLENVLTHIQSLTKKVVHFVIALTPDGTKTLPDGRDPHLIVETPNWWVDKISNYFEIKKFEVGKRQELVLVAVPFEQSNT